MPLYTGHTAQYDPLGIWNGVLYLLTDRDAPNKKIVSVPIDRPDPANWKTLVAEGKFAIQDANMVAGKIAVNSLEDAASTVRFYALDGTRGPGVDAARASARSAGRAAASSATRCSTPSRRRSTRPPCSATTSA